MTTKKLTKRQQEVLDYIKDYWNKNKYSPAYRNVAVHFDISVKRVYDHIHALEKRGHITFTPGIGRSIVIVEDKKVEI